MDMKTLSLFLVILSPAAIIDLHQTRDSQIANFYAPPRKKKNKKNKKNKKVLREWWVNDLLYKQANKLVPTHPHPTYSTEVKKQSHLPTLLSRKSYFTPSTYSTQIAQ